MSPEIRAIVYTVFGLVVALTLLGGLMATLIMRESDKLIREKARLALSSDADDTLIDYEMLRVRRTNRTRAMWWGIVGAVATFVGIGLMIYTHYQYNWFTGEWTGFIAACLVGALVLEVILQETEGKPWWRFFGVMLLMSVLCGVPSPM